MAKKPTAPAPAYEPEAEYHVTLGRAVRAAGMTLRPRDGLRLKGKVIADLGDAVIAAEKVD